MLKKLCCLILLVLLVLGAALPTVAQSDEFSIVGYWITAQGQTGYVFAPNGTGRSINSDGTTGNTFEYVFDGETLTFYDAQSIVILKIADFTPQGLIVFYDPKDRFYFTGIRAGTEFKDLPTVPVERDDLVGTWWYGRDMSVMGFDASGQVIVSSRMTNTSTRWKITDHSLYAFLSDTPETSQRLPIVLLTDTLMIWANNIVFYRIPEAAGIFGAAATSPNGNWQFDSTGILYTTSSYPGSSESLFLQQTDLADFVFSADVAAGHCEATLALRMQDDQNGYLVVYRPVNNGDTEAGLYVVKLTDGVETILKVVAPGIPTSQEWVSLEVTADGNQMLIVIDNKGQTTVTDTTYASGRNGFFVYANNNRGCNTRFKDFRMQPS